MSQLHANYRLEFYSDVHEFKTIVFQEWRNETNEYFPPLCSLTRSQVFSKKNTSRCFRVQDFENGCQSGDLWKRRSFVFMWTAENGSSNIRCHTSYSHALRKGSYHIRL